MMINSFRIEVARRSRPGAAIQGAFSHGVGANVALAGALPGAAPGHASAGYRGTAGCAAAANPRPRKLNITPKTILNGVTASGQPIEIRNYVHMTRVNAGGDGASGPHPERAPA